MRRASSNGRRFCWPPTRGPATMISRPAWALAARPSTGPSSASCAATWRRRCARNRALEQAGSSQAKRKPCWLRPPVPSRRRAAPVGRWSCWPASWSGSPSTAVSPVRPCADGWPRTISSLGARTCGAFRRSTASTSPAWRMSSTSMPKSPIRSIRWSVSTRAPPSSSARSASRSGRAGPARALRLRVQAQWDRQPVHLPRCASILAQGQSHRQPRRSGLRRLHA